MITDKGLIQLGFNPLDDFVLQDDGNGTYISEWLSSSNRPTTADIEAAHVVWQEERDTADTAKANRLASVKSKLEALGLTAEEVQDAFGI
jgi:hypothetical protein